MRISVVKISMHNVVVVSNRKMKCGVSCLSLPKIPLMRGTGFSDWPIADHVEWIETEQSRAEPRHDI